MKTKLFLVLVSLCFTTLLISTKIFAQDKDMLDNQSIISLHKLGMEESVILNKIKSSECNFDVSLIGLVSLKEAGISENIINKMLDTDTRMKSDAEAEAAYAEQHAPGIFYINPLGEEIELKSNLYSSGKTNSTGRTLAQTVGSFGGLGGQLITGAVNAKTKAVLPTPNAEVQIQETSPEFYFYFETTESGLSNTGNTLLWYNVVTNPNELILIEMQTKKRSREVITARANSYKSKVGVRNKDSIQFRFEEIDAGVYRVYFDKPLKAGEYCFVYAGAVATTAGMGQKVFDFGITK